ncbi:hypothetical protein D3C87_1657250 [compost metagenome]
MWPPAFVVRIAEEEPSALERLPVPPPEIPESPEFLRDLHLETPARLVHLVRLEILEIPRRFPALEKIPYMIAPFNE